MKVFYRALALTAFAISLGCACETNSPLPSLPRSWTNAELQASLPVGGTLEKPSQSITDQVKLAFQLHTDALSAVARHANRLMIEDSALVSGSTNGADIPWHLDGMIASFGVDVGGVFGALSGDGAVGVKVTWQQEQKKIADSSPTRAEKKAIHFRARMTNKDVHAILEPAIRAAVATKSVRDASALRKNLTIEASRFLSVAKILSTLPAKKGWHIGGYQLGLFFNASGSVSATMGAGGGVALIFDWDQSELKSSVAKPLLNPLELKIQKNMAAFTSGMSALIPEAQTDSAELLKAGFELEVFQVGLGIAAGGTVGVASLNGSAAGRIIFKTDFNSTHASQSTFTSYPPRKPEMIPFIRSGEAAGIFEISTESFRNGLRRAIEMGAYFTRNAVAADTKDWKVTEIEAAFDSSVGGDLTLLTIGGVGLVRLGFERIN